MATNAKEVETKEETIVEPAVDAEADLRQAKEESETNPTPEATPSEEESTKEEESPVIDPAETVSETTLTTSEPDKDLDWYKTAYEQSTKEALRLKGELEKTPEPPTAPAEGLTAAELYVKQKQDEEIAQAFSEVTERYPQVKEPEEYKKFTEMANTFGKTILEAQGRLATPKELYAKTAIALGWADDSKEKLSSALKDSAASPSTSSGSPAPPTTSKVTDAMIIANRKMYPGKSDSEIREELEPHVQ